MARNRRPWRAAARWTLAALTTTTAMMLAAGCVVIVNPGVISTVAGGLGAGPATSLGQRPYGVAVSGSSLYINDPMFTVVRRVDLATGTSTVVAGNGGSGSTGDGGSALAAQMYDNYGLAVDAAGNLYIADSGNHRVRRVTVGGTITTVAGTGVAGNGGDGGPASMAQLRKPTAVAVDSVGNLFIADAGNNKVRRVAVGGIITTVAGTGVAGSGGDGGPATGASLNNPFGVASAASGDVFVAELGGARVRRFTVGGMIATVAGTGTGGFNGDGPATASQLNGPTGLAVDGDGNLLIADSINNRVRKLAASALSTVAGNGVAGYGGDGGPAVAASLYRPNGVAVDASGNLYIGDTFNRVARRVGANGTISTVSGNGSVGFNGDGNALTAQLAHPYSTAVDGAGNIYIADHANHRIRKLAAGGSALTTVAGNGTPGFSGDGGPATSASLNYPDGVAAAPDGTLFIADTFNHRVRKVSTSGVITTLAGTGVIGGAGDGGAATDAQLNEPEGIAVDNDGVVYIADTKNHRVRKVDAAGAISVVAGIGGANFSGDGGPAVAAQLNLPAAVAVNGSGEVFVADGGNRRVRKVSAGGTITTVAGNGGTGSGGDGGQATSASMTTPSGVAVDAMGNIFIADFNAHRIRRVNASGVISSVAGTGVQGWSGDGGPATTSTLAHPHGVTLDAALNLLVADTSTNKIRKVIRNW